MFTGTVAFFIGVLLLQLLPELPQLSLLALPLITLLLLGLLSSAARPLSIVALGFLYALFRATLLMSETLPTELAGETIEVVGTIASIPEHSRPQRFQFQIEPDVHYRGPGRVRLSWQQPPAELRVGQQWRLAIRLKQPNGYMNPGGFDYERWLLQHGIRANGYVRTSSRNRLMNDEGGALVARARQQIKLQLQEQLGSDPQQGILTALAIGVRDGISQPQWQVLRRTGTTHLMAISGLHIGLIAGFIFLLTRWGWSLSSRLPLLWSAQRAAALAALIAALLYAALAGFSVPTIRALIMVSVLMAALLTGRNTAPLHTLALALLLVLIYDPLSLLGPGFWLSFAAVTTILYVTNHRLAPSGLWWQWGRIHLLIAIGLLPLMVILFGQLSLISPLANLVAVPWMGLLVLPLDLAGTLLSILSPTLGGWLLQLSSWALSLLWWLLEWLASFELATIYVAVVAWTAVAAVAGVLLLLTPRGFPARWLGAVMILPLFLNRPPAPAEGEAWFTLLDVGQGLSAVVRTRNHTLLFDAGPHFRSGFNTGEAVVLPFLRQAGVERIDTMVISHGDNDHIGGARPVAREIEIGRVVSGVPHRLLDLGAEACRSGDQWRWDGVLFEMIHPIDTPLIEGNDGSCVVRVSVESHRLLLTGDIEASAEQELIERYGSELQAELLVAPHHGSLTSSTDAFIDVVDPEIVLFPVGYRNRYRFPRSEVVARYQSRGMKLYDSAQHGAITVKFGVEGISSPQTYRLEAQRYWHRRW